MKRFKVVLVDFGGNTVPAWVGETLQNAGIEFVAQACRTPDEVVQCAADADVIWNWGSRLLTPESLAQLPRCGAIIRTGSGTDNIPVEAATEHGIVVAHMPAAHSEAVSDHAIALLLAVVRGLIPLDRRVRGGQWMPPRPSASWHLHGQTLGLVGFGHASRLVARKLRGFELDVLAYDPFVSPDVFAREHVTPVNLDTLLSNSDFVSLHCPLTPATYHLLGERELRLMKPTAILVNTARGPVIDEPALVRALTQGWLAGAGLDVLEQEPAAPDNPLFLLDNVVLTPHVAGRSDEDIELCFRYSVDAALALAQGHYPAAYVNHGVKPRWDLS
jgi:D-3-phosphoglycerate dehydrogenase / 2-oxoglutarate reductase